MVYVEDRSAYLVHTDEGVCVYSLQGDDSTPEVVWNVKDTILQACWSSRGSYLSMNSAKKGVLVYYHTSWKDSTVLPSCLSVADFGAHSFTNPQALKHIQWSPLDTYFVCFWRHQSNTSQTGVQQGKEPEKKPKDSEELIEGRNVLIWKVFTEQSPAKGDSKASFSLKLTGSFTLKGVVPGQWPIIRWRNDERYCCVVSRSEICIYDADDVGGKILFQLPLYGILSCDPAPSYDKGPNAETLTVAGFLSHAQHGQLYIVHISDFANSQWSIISQETLGPAEMCKFQWNCHGNALLALASVAVDAIGENYGEVGDAYLLNTTGGFTGKLNSEVAQDGCWSPVRNEFVLIQGRCPSEILLYDAQGIILYRFPKAYCNTIRWDPYGRMLALGGFGNLAGDISLWYRPTKTVDSNELVQLIFKWRESCTVLCHWSPNGQYFFTASTFPRMKVDNFLKIFTYQGISSCRQAFQKLFDFQWKPLLHDQSIEPPSSPKSRMHLAQQSIVFDLESLVQSQKTSNSQPNILKAQEETTAKACLKKYGKDSLQNPSKTSCEDHLKDPFEKSGKKACKKPSKKSSDNSSGTSLPLQKSLQPPPQPQQQTSHSSQLLNTSTFSSQKKQPKQKEFTSLETPLPTSSNPPCLKPPSFSCPPHQHEEVLCSLNKKDSSQSGRVDTLEKGPDLVDLLRQILPKEAQIHVSTSHHSFSSEAENGSQFNATERLQDHTERRFIPQSHLPSTVDKKPLHELSFLDDELSQFMLSHWVPNSTSLKRPQMKNPMNPQEENQQFHSTVWDSTNEVPSYRNIQQLRDLKTRGLVAQDNPLQTSLLRETHRYPAEAYPFQHVSPSVEALDHPSKLSNYAKRKQPQPLNAAAPEFTSPTLYDTSYLPWSLGSKSFNPSERYPDHEPIPAFRNTTWQAAVPEPPLQEHHEPPLPPQETSFRSAHPFYSKFSQLSDLRMEEPLGKYPDSFDSFARQPFNNPSITTNSFESLFHQKTSHHDTKDNNTFTHPTLNPYHDACWEYLDPQGQIQGPFSLTQMKTWHSLNYFPRNLLVRVSPTSKFRPFLHVMQMLNVK